MEEAERKLFYIRPLPLVVGEIVDKGTDQVIRAILPKEPKVFDAKMRKHPGPLFDGKP